MSRYVAFLLSPDVTWIFSVADFLFLFVILL